VQKCPRCGSSRIRRGYRPTPWWSAVVGRYNLLCNSCNWEFVGFAIPGTVSSGSRKRVRTSPEDIKFTPLEIVSASEEVDETFELSETVTLIEKTETAAAAKQDEDLLAETGKNSLIESVLITEEDAEIKPEESKLRLRRKRRVKAKSALKMEK
jgi:hypothetical protein